MRRRFGQSLRIGVGPQAVALVACNRWRRGEVTVLAEQRCAGAGNANPDAAATVVAIGDAVDAVLRDAGCDGWPATIVLADVLARLWQVAPPSNAARLGDLEAACAFRFQHLFGDSPAGWRIAADFAANRPFLAAALPRALLARLDRSAAAHRLKVLEIVPQFVAARNRWRAALPAGGWFGLVHENVLTMGAGSLLRSVAVPAQAGPDWLLRQVEREALRLNTDAPGRLVLAGGVPAAWRGAQGLTVLGAENDWSGAVRLAATGSAA